MTNARKSILRILYIARCYFSSHDSSSHPENVVLLSGVGPTQANALRHRHAQSEIYRLFGLPLGSAFRLPVSTSTFVAVPIRSSKPSITPSTTSLHETNRQLEAILWDMDGVLADTERDGHRPAFNQAFLEQNLDTIWDIDRYGKLLEIGGGKERMTAHWNEVGWPDSIPMEQRQEIVLKLHLRKTDIFMDFINAGKIPLRPGVRRLIDDAIAANIQLAVCSTSNVQAVTNLVRTLLGPDRAAKFQIFAGDMVRKKKPAPDVYLMAVDQMQLDPSKCVIVEDSHIGLGAAKAAGITCLVTKSYYTQSEDFTGAQMIVDELGDDPTSAVTLSTLTQLIN